MLCEEVRFLVGRGKKSVRIFFGLFGLFLDFLIFFGLFWGFLSKTVNLTILTIFDHFAIFLSILAIFDNFKVGGQKCPEMVKHG